MWKYFSVLINDSSNWYRDSEHIFTQSIAEGVASHPRDFNKKTLWNVSLELKTSKEENAPRKSQEKSCFLKNDSQFTQGDSTPFFVIFLNPIFNRDFLLKVWNVSLEVKISKEENLKKNLKKNPAMKNDSQWFTMEPKNFKDTSTESKEQVGNKQKAKQIRVRLAVHKLAS